MSHTRGPAERNPFISVDHASAIDGLKCADLVDAMGRFHRHRCHMLDLVTPTPGRVLFGAAVTISYFPSCSASLDPERYNLANLFYEAVGDDPEGKVLVLASNGYTDVSMGGGTKLSRLQRHGLAGCAHRRTPP
jgi:regulator of RNase E activity RraA